MECIARYDFAAGRPDELSFRENDTLKIRIDSENQEDDWATAELGGSVGLIPKNYITSPPWFYNGLSRNRAEAILQDNEPDGAFLIRESESCRGDFSLSVKFGNGVQHFKILVDKATRRVFLWEKKFDTINQLVAFFRKNSVSKTNNRVFLRNMVKDKSVIMDPTKGASGANGVACSFQQKQSPWSKVGQQKSTKPAVEQKPRAKAIYDFEPQGGNELGLRAGDVVEVLDKADCDWWLGRHQAKTGLFPSTYVQEI